MHDPVFTTLRARFKGSRWEEELALHVPQRIKTTVPGSDIQLELDALETDQPAQQQANDEQPPQQQKDNSRKLFRTPLGFLGQLDTSREADVWSASLWKTFFCTTLGGLAPILSPNYPKTCACAAFNIDAYGDHVHICNKIDEITSAHNWAVGAFVPSSLLWAILSGRKSK